MPGKLVIFYTRAGSTGTAANKIAEQLDCDTAEIISKKKFRGLFGWLAAGRSAAAGLETGIIEPDIKTEDYDLIILCSPIWASGIPSPVRTWLKGNSAKYSRIAYLLTYNGGGEKKALAKFAALGGEPKASVTLSIPERRNGIWLEKLETFAGELN